MIGGAHLYHKDGKISSLSEGVHRNLLSLRMNGIQTILSNTNKCYDAGTLLEGSQKGEGGNRRVQTCYGHGVISGATNS